MTEKKTEIPGVYKVCEGILINKDNDALMAYKMRKFKETRIDYIEEDVRSLKGDMETIKGMLRELLQR